MILVIVLFLLLLIIYYVCIYEKQNKIEICNKDAKSDCYMVVKDFDNYEEAAEQLHKINTTIVQFLKYLSSKYHIHDDSKFESDNMPNYDFRRMIVRRMVDMYNPKTITENTPGVGGTSYTINKGDSIHVCLRQLNKPNELHNIDDISFVVLHELAHIGNPLWNHTAEFWEVFKFILYEAKNSELFTIIDYQNNPVPYCGLSISYSPLFDKNVKSLWQ